MDSDYWRRTAGTRVSRRRAIAASGGVALGAAFLAACGGGDDDGGGEKKSSSGLISAPVDTSKSAKRGGVVKGSANTDIPTFDAFTTSVPNRVPVLCGYSRILQLKPGYLQASSGEVIGDLGESWEFSPDKTQLTFKLRKGALNAPLAPVNARAMDAQDIVYSWNRFAALGAARGTLANSVDPSAPVESVSATDNQTVVFKLKNAPASMLINLANTTAGNLFIVPREAESGFDLRRTVIGSGPFYISEYTPSVRVVYKRNPGYYDKERPYVDGVETPIVSEYATALAQFKAGNIYAYALRGDDILQTKKEIPELNLQLGDVSVNLLRTFFGWKASPPEKTPFRDERVRQAFSMSWDRDLWIDTFYNIEKYRANGIPLETRWNSAVQADNFDGWWVDPKGKDLGPDARFYQHDLAEAKKLLAAAGFPSGVDIESYHITTSENGVDFPRNVEVLIGMALDAGIRIKTVPVAFANEYQKVRDAKGNFEGMSYRLSAVVGFLDVGEKLYNIFNSKGQLFTGFDPDGKGTFAGDPQVDEITTRIRSEFDFKKRTAAALELQKLIARKQYTINSPGGAPGLTLGWPALQNRGVYRVDGPQYYYNWLDQTQAPLKKPA